MFPLMAQDIEEEKRQQHKTKQTHVFSSTNFPTIVQTSMSKKVSQNRQNTKPKWSQK